MNTIKPLVLAFALAAGSFAGGSGCYVGGEVVATAETPRMVWVGDGIWVLEDWPYSVYYYDNFYWRYIDGYWYRSAWYDSGFVRVSVWPRTLVRVHRSGSYRYYRAPRGARTRVVPRTRPNVRDRRTPSRTRRR